MFGRNPNMPVGGAFSGPNQMPMPNTHIFPFPTPGQNSPMSNIPHNPWLPRNMWNNLKGGVQGALADPNAFMDRLTSNKAFGAGIGLLSNPQNPAQGLYGGLKSATEVQNAQQQAQRQQLLQGVFKDILEAWKAQGKYLDINVEDIINSNL